MTVTGIKGNVARIILRKRNLSRNIVSNHVLIRSRSDEKNVLEKFVSGLEVTLSEAKKYNLFSQYQEAALEGM